MAIGDTCIRWGILESIVHDIALHLAMYLDPAFKTETARHILHLTLSNMDPREKTATAKALAHKVNTTDSPDFYEKADALLNHLDNILRPERNRYVHDIWAHDGQSFVRLKLGARVIRPQARQRELHLWTERRYENVKAIRGFVTNLELAQLDLIDLDNHIAWLMGQREQPGAHRQPLPREWRSLAHRDWREPDKHQPQP